MSKLYDDVKKQGEQIDDLQKTVTNHGTRIETLETQAMATPTNSDVPIPNVTARLFHLRKSSTSWNTVIL